LIFIDLLALRKYKKVFRCVKIASAKAGLHLQATLRHSIQRIICHPFLLSVWRHGKADSMQLRIFSLAFRNVDTADLQALILFISVAKHLRYPRSVISFVGSNKMLVVKQLHVTQLNDKTLHDS
jgi:hypothetical protein